jgi:hypothetical protein
VFCHPQTGGPLDHKHYAVRLRAALGRAKVDRPMRPFHDGHTSITNGAAAGISPAALMARAGHSDFKTTQLYIDLAGETFREEAERLDERLFGPVGQKSGQNLAPPSADRPTRSPATAGLSRTGPAGLEPATPGFGDMGFSACSSVRETARAGARASTARGFVQTFARKKFSEN